MSRIYPWEQDGNTLVLETPEQTRVEYRLAPFGSRLVAAILDRLIIVGFVLGVCLPLALIGAMSGGVIVALAVIGYFALSVFYYFFAELFGEGRTPGKRRCRIRTVLASGQGLTAGAAFLRNLARLVDELPPTWLIPLLTKGNRRIGDFLAGTYVIREDGAPGAQASGWLERLAPSYAELEEKRFPFGAGASEELCADDLNLIEYLDSGLVRLPTARARRRTLRAVALKYADRLGIEDTAALREDPERFLQELGLFLRDRYERRW